MRTFDTGATRDDDASKLDYEGFLSPSAIERYAQYMHKHRKQADGKMRASDNWQKGIPIAQYVKSLFRHFVDVWKWRRGYLVDIEDALCAVVFNAFGILHELIATRRSPREAAEAAIEPPTEGCSAIDTCHGDGPAGSCHDCPKKAA